MGSSVGVYSDCIYPVTKEPGYHFFGYYDKHQFDPRDRYLLGLEIGFMNRSPGPDDVALVQVIDLSEGDKAETVGQTRAWCWQQGCMLQWLPGGEFTIVYNDRIGGRFVAVVHDLRSGRKKVLPRPIYTISPDGRWALSLNFSRNAVTRPGYGYNGLTDHWQNEDAPAEDGVYLMDMESGEHELVVSIADLAASDPTADMAGGKHWVNHLLFSPDSQRFIFLHRWQAGQGSFRTRMYTADRNGSRRHRVPIKSASHFIWCDASQILVWAATKEHGRHFYLCRDRSETVRPFAAGVLNKDGHCTVSPDGKWVLTDEYPDEQYRRPLLLYGIESGERIELGRFYSPPVARNGELRCDLHPRWNRRGDRICFDSAHEGTRQIYVADLEAILSAR